MFNFTRVQLLFRANWIETVLVEIDWPVIFADCPNKCVFGDLKPRLPRLDTETDQLKCVVNGLEDLPLVSEGRVLSDQELVLQGVRNERKVKVFVVTNLFG